MTVEITVSRDLPMEPQVFLAAQALLNGEVIVFPTETVYGVAADALNDEAIDNLISIKERPDNKPFPVMVADLAMAEQYADLGNARELAKDFWPGPLTLVLPARGVLSSACTGNGTIGVRCPHHPVAQALLNIVGIPLAVPSANRAGEPPATTSTEAMRAFRGYDIAFKIYQQDPTMGQPTTVLKIEPNTWTILRKGPVSADTIREYLPNGVTLCGA
ncbi:MAG: threonylcarbamoyl-AMP synthase [Proteobacteria bacterium]|nr:threonylcarbamoyl-AMP synthase [Pseudomonadota bacterium]